MGNIHLVTGFAGHQHITSADQAVFNSLMFGGGQYVLAKGNQFAASIVTNNQINVLDGDILMQGRHIRLNEATSVDLTIENGAQGYFRNDLIVVRYTKDESTGIEDANLVVIKGTAAAGNPADPPYTSGDLVNGNAILNDMPLYRVQLDGLNISALVPLFEVVEFDFDSLRDSFNTFSDLHRVNHYRTLAAVGISDNDLNAEDAKANLAAIYSAMPVESEMWLTLASGASNAPNLWNSLMTKLQADLSATWTSALLVRLVKRSYVMEVYAIAQSTGYYFYEYGCTFRYYASANNYLSAFSVTRDPDGFVSKSGSTFKQGAKLKFKASTGAGLEFKTMADGSNIGAFDDVDDSNSDRAVLKIFPPNLKSHAEALRLGETKGGKTTWSIILHTGNMADLISPDSLNMEGFAHVATGSYIGTGSVLTNKPLEFGFQPKLVFIVANQKEEVATGVFVDGDFAYCSAPWIYPVKKNLSRMYSTGTTSGAMGTVDINWESTGIKLTGDTVANEFNESSKIYHYIALG